MLGDLVGYCADPNAVVERVQALAPAAIVRGNHDKVACGLEQADGFNAVAKRAAHWTHDTLTPANRAWLAALPRGPVIVDELVEICHGSPFDEDAYIFDELDAVRALKTSQRPLCLFGHTHWPVTFELTGRTRGDHRRGERLGRPPDPLQAGVEIPAESWIGRPAARRRSPRGLRHRGHGDDDGRADSAWTIRSRRRRRR